MNHTEEGLSKEKAQEVQISNEGRSNEIPIARRTNRTFARIAALTGDAFLSRVQDTVSGVFLNHKMWEFSGTFPFVHPFSTSPQPP